MKIIANITDNHNEIRKWVKGLGGRPQLIVDQSSESGPRGLRIDFLDSQGETFLTGTSLRNVSWEDFFDEFESQKLSFMFIENYSQDRAGSLSQSYQFVPRIIHKERKDELRNVMKEFINKYDNFLHILAM